MEAQRHCKWFQRSLLLMNVSRPHIYKEPAELHCPLQVVPEEVTGTTHRSRDCSVWESDTLHWDKSHHCTGRSPLPKDWAVLAVQVWLKTPTVGDAGWGGLPAVKDYCAYICGAHFVLIVTWWEPLSWWQNVAVCVLPSAFLQGTVLFWCCSYKRRLPFTRKTSSSIRNTAGAVLGVGLSVSLGLKLPNLAPSPIPCHDVGIIFGSVLASSSDSSCTNSFGIIRWESPEWSEALLPVQGFEHPSFSVSCSVMAKDWKEPLSFPCLCSHLGLSDTLNPLIFRQCPK